VRSRRRSGGGVYTRAHVADWWAMRSYLSPHVGGRGQVRDAVRLRVLGYDGWVQLDTPSLAGGAGSNGTGTLGQSGGGVRVWDLKVWVPEVSGCG
jgi:hypothetical protein